jgi:uncharacterized protein YjbI with pentapeptide repeats
MKKIIIGIIILLLFIVVISIGLYNYQAEVKVFYNKLAKYFFEGSSSPKGELTKLLLSIIGALGVFVGIWASLKRANALEKGLKNQNKQYNLSLKSQIDQRFKNAIEHLGDEKEPIILGGIVELHQVAKENQEDYAEVVFNILTSYIRAEASIYKKHVEDVNFTIIQTIVDYIFKEKNNSIYNEFSANLRNTNLSSINFENSNLNNTNFSFCILPSLSEVTIKGADLSSVHFAGSHIFKGIDFSTSNLFYTKFKNLVIDNCIFNSDDLGKTLFHKCSITNSQFIGSEISGCYFINSFLSNNSYNIKGIISSTFWGTTITNADFTNFSLIGSNDFRLSSLSNIITNTLITGSNFGGCNELTKWNKNILDDIFSKINSETNLNGLTKDRKMLFNCNTETFTKEDAIEIKDKYSKILVEHEIVTRKIKKF